MRIALFHNLPSGGAKRALHEWARRLAPSHRLDVYTTTSADHGFCDIRPFAQRYRVFEFAPRRLFDSPWGRLNQLQRWRDLGDLERLAHRIASEIDDGSYDVVFAHTCLHTTIPTLLQFLATPAVYYLHEAIGQASVRRFSRPYLRQNRWRKLLDRLDPLIALYTRRLDTLQRRSIRRVSLLLANSHFTRQQMQDAFAVQPPVCHYGVDSDGFRPLAGARRADYVLSVGELSPRKGFDFIVQSLQRISPARRPRLKLACNSVDPLERAYVESLAAHNGVDLQIETNLDTAELALLYGQARLCVYAPVLEPFGLVPLEAMACGTAVVGVAEGGVQESIIHGVTGLLTDRDPVQFAGAVEYLLSDPALASAYGRNGREAVLSHWTWEQSTAALEDYLHACACVRGVKAFS